MIAFPRRSVTRFFIPLIDVLTLLFCIFLLMPMIKETGETQESLNSPVADLTLWQEGRDNRNAALAKEDRPESGAVAKERENGSLATTSLHSTARNRRRHGQTVLSRSGRSARDRKPGRCA